MRNEQGAREGRLRRDPLAFGGEMGAQLREVDWARTPLGPVDAWPTSLKTVVGLALGSRCPMLVWWGATHVQIYNDACRPILRDKHPGSIAAPGAEVWREIWPVLAPLAAGIFAGGPAACSERLRLPVDRNGFAEEAYFTFSCSPIPGDHGEIGGVLVTPQETTASAQSQTAEAQRRVLYDLFMQAPEPICVMGGGDDLVFEMANDAYRGLFPGRELLGKRLLDAMPELAGQGYDELMHEVLRSGTTVTLRSAMARIRRGGQLGETHWDFVYAPLRDSEGALDRVMVLAHEITHEARAREELEAARRQAEQARRQAEQASRAKDEFLAMLGHELRNPLAPILTATELMDHQGGDVFQRERAVIRRQLRHVVRLVDDLLDVSRITRGSIALERKPVELAVIAAKAIEQVSPLIGQRRHTLASEVPASGLIVHGDETRLAQVLANLLANAAKYTPAGGRIGVTASTDGCNVRVTVSDNGVGISAGLLPHVFELFKQGEQGIDRARGGLGLGLAIAKAIVELHGGRISATSPGPGRGSEFSVLLPRMVAHAHPAVESSELHDDVEPRRVLVVDDNCDLLETVAELIACVGHEVTIAHDGLEAWAKLGRDRFDVALLDIGLPGLSGYELVEKIRADERMKDMQVIALTGYGGADARDTAMTAGFDAYLVKPIDLAQLRVLIATGSCKGAHTRRD
jgi:signal transduction histidine kinase/ActR/RegA family two-component response regulator